MSAKVLAFPPPDPWTTRPPAFTCLVCDAPCDLDDYEPFCSSACCVAFLKAHEFPLKSSAS